MEPRPIPTVEVAPKPTLRDAARSALNVFAFSFVGVLGPSLLGWLGQVKDWADSSGADPFPRTSSLGFVAVSALIAAGPAAVALVWRSTQVTLGMGRPPTYAPTPVAPATYNVADGPPEDRPAH